MESILAFSVSLISGLEILAGVIIVGYFVAYALSVLLYGLNVLADQHFLCHPLILSLSRPPLPRTPRTLDEYFQAQKWARRWMPIVVAIEIFVTFWIRVFHFRPTGSGWIWVTLWVIGLTLAIMSGYVRSQKFDAKPIRCVK